MRIFTGKRIRNQLIYTALFGNYDTVAPALYEATIFADCSIKAKGWKVEVVEQPHDLPTYSSRYYFDQSCLVMPDSEFTIMHGANAQLTMPPSEVIKLLPNGCDLACFAHPHRTNVYQEAEACIKYRKDRKDVINAQMERYKAEGFPESVRLSTCIFLVRRNTPALREFEDMWWDEVKKGSCRDQLSFDYCRWKMDFQIAYIEGNPYHRKDIFKVGKHIPSR